MRLAPVVVLAGCWQPAYPVGLACSDAGTCPPEQVCRAGVCHQPDDPIPPDAGPFDGSTDAPDPPRIDAALSAAGLGVSCGPGFPCPETTPICKSTDGDGTNGFCTLECDLGDDSPCQSGYTQAAGVPRCLFADDIDNPTAWYCGLLCGTGSPSDDGACPYSLSCVLQQDGDAPSEICGE
jgi:hypothetical protein